MTRGEAIQAAIERHDAATLRKISKGARKEGTRMFRNLLADFIHRQPKKATPLKRTA